VIKAKNGTMIFENVKEFNEAVNRKYKPLIEEEIKKYQANLEIAKREATKDALIMLLPIVSTALYEAYNFGEKRQEKFIEYFLTHMACINQGITDLEQYREFCKDQGYKYFNVVEIK